jgi:hypothetical protein
MITKVQYELWFKNKQDYARANSKKLSEESRSADSE